MANYNDFTLNEWQINELKKKKAARLIADYIKKNGSIPTNTESFYVMTDEELEDYKRRFWALYNVEGSVPFIPVNPETPEEPSDPNDIKNYYQYMIWADYDVIDITNDTTLLYTSYKGYPAGDYKYNIKKITRMVIDDTEVSPVSSYKFDSFGKHSIGILLEDITNMSSISFYGTRITKIIIPECIATITESYQAPVKVTCGG